MGHSSVYTYVILYKYLTVYNYIFLEIIYTKSVKRNFRINRIYVLCLMMIFFILPGRRKYVSITII